MYHDAVTSSSRGPYVAQLFGPIMALTLAAVLSPYVFGGLTFLCFAFAFPLARRPLRMRDWEVLLLGGVALTFAEKLFGSSVFNAIQTFRFFYGFFFFYFFFRTGVRLPLTPLLLFCALLVIVESVAINTVLDPQRLHVYPDFATHAARTQIMGFYQRPYSFGASPSVTSSLLVILMTMARDQRLDRRLPWTVSLATHTAVFLCMSGTGFFTLALYWWLFMPRSRKVVAIVAVAGAYGALLLAGMGLQGLNRSLPSVLTKLRPEYIESIYLVKRDQIAQLVALVVDGSSAWELIFGHSFQVAGQNAVGGDFGWISRLVSVGFVGFVFLGVVTAARTSRYNYRAIFLFFASSLHYSTVDSVIGQILFGYCLAHTAPLVPRQRGEPIEPSHESLVPVRV